MNCHFKLQKYVLMNSCEPNLNLDFMPQLREFERGAADVDLCVVAAAMTVLRKLWTTRGRLGGGTAIILSIWKKLSEGGYR